MPVARIIDYSIKLNKQNKLYIQVLFQTTDSKNYRWFGSFNEGMARNITNDSLKKMGLRIPNEDELLDSETPSQAIMRLLNKGVEGGILNDSIDYEIEIETSAGLDGKENTKVRSIRLPGERAVRSLSEEDLKAAMGNSSIGDELFAKAIKYPREEAATEDEAPF